jgi:hypothetical protein
MADRNCKLCAGMGKVTRARLLDIGCGVKSTVLYETDCNCKKTLAPVRNVATLSLSLSL